MSEKELNTNDFEDDISLASQLGRTRRNRRIVSLREQSEAARTNTDEESGSDAGSAKEPVRHTVQQDGRRKMRITMLGISGSGKTAFLSGVYQTMMMGSYHGLTLLPSESTDEAFQQIGQIADIALVNRENYEFALGTEETTVFPLTLEDCGKEICDFDFTDYRGGDVFDILNARGDVSSSAKVLRNQLMLSDAILIFADAQLLCRGKSVVEWQKATGATMINPLFNMLARSMGNRPLTVLFVLTKTDDESIPYDMKANHFARLAERVTQAFHMVYQVVQGHIDDGWSFGIVPVSAVGEGNSETVRRNVNGHEVRQSVVKEGCAPEPYNIEATMIYTIACILSQWKKAANEEIEDLTARLVEEGRSNTLIWNIFSDMKKVKRPQEKVAALLEEIETKNQDIMTLDAHIMDLIDKTGAGRVIQRRRDHLDI